MNQDRLHELIDRLFDGTLSPAEHAELVELLRHAPEARSAYWEAVEQDALLNDLVRESAGQDLAHIESEDLAISRISPPVSTGLRRSSHRMIAAGLGLVAVIGLVMAVLFLAPVAPVAPEPLVAEIRSLSGDVWLEEGQQARRKAASGQAIRSDSKLQVDEDSTVDVVLVDGSRLALGSNSIMKLSDQRLHLERGSAEIEAVPQSPETPLVITTDEAKLTVLGTHFRLYAGSNDSRVELEEGKVAFERQADGDRIEVSAGQFVVATGSDTPKPLVAQSVQADWRLRQSWLRAGSRVIFSHDGARLATANQNDIKVWSSSTGDLMHTLKNAGNFACLAFTPMDDNVVALSLSGHAIVWKLGNAAPKRADLKCAMGNLRGCAVSPDGRWLAQATSADAGDLPIWHVERDDAAPVGSEEFTQVRSIPIKMGRVALATPTTGPQVVASQWNGTTIKWEADTGKELAHFRFKSELHVLTLSADGRLLAGYGNTDGLIVVDTVTGDRRDLWPGGGLCVKDLGFSRDGKLVFAAMADGVVRAWQAADGRPILILPTGDAHLMTVALSPDGRWLATACNRGNVKLWEGERP